MARRANIRYTVRMNGAAKSVLRGLTLAFLFSLFFVSHAMAQNPQGPPPEPYFAPELNVPIPGLDFTEYPITQSSGTIAVPFFSAYVGAIYRYMLSVVVVIATVMFVFGAFQYLLGTAITQIKKGKQIMIDAVMGMLLVFASYMILRTVNPATLNPKGLEFKSVQQEAFRQTIVTMGTTKESTTLPNYLSAPGSGDVDAPKLPSEPVPPGGGTYIQGQCPVILPPGSGYNEYYAAVLPYMTGTTIAERIFQAADIAISCHKNLGSCGHVAGVMWGLAGVGGTNKCLFDPKKSCEWLLLSRKATKVIRSVSSKPLWGLLCENSCSPKQKGELPAIAAQRGFNCASSQGAAINAARKIIKGVVGGDWPNTWADGLQPGDWIYSYSGNKECDGLHSYIFLEWQDQKKGWAYVVQGQANKNVNYARRCLKTACGGEERGHDVITSIFRPQ